MEMTGDAAENANRNELCVDWPSLRHGNKQRMACDRRRSFERIPLLSKLIPHDCSLSLSRFIPIAVSCFVVFAPFLSPCKESTIFLFSIRSFASQRSHGFFKLIKNEKCQRFTSFVALLRLGCFALFFVYCGCWLLLLLRKRLSGFVDLCVRNASTKRPVQRVIEWQMPRTSGSDRELCVNIYKNVNRSAEWLISVSCFIVLLLLFDFYNKSSMDANFGFFSCLDFCFIINDAN